MGATQSHSAGQPTSLASLPAEIRQKIAEEVAGPQLPFPRCFKELKQQRINDLRHCALVSQGFRQLAEPILYRNVVLQLDRLPSISEKLDQSKKPVEKQKVKLEDVKPEPGKERNGQAKSLGHFPHLRQHVRSLTIDGQLLGKDSGYAKSPPFDTLRDIMFNWLERMPEVVRVKLVSFNFDTFPMLVANLPLVPKPALSKLTSLFIEPNMSSPGVSKRFAAALTGFEKRPGLSGSLTALVLDTPIDSGWSSFKHPKGKTFPPLKHLELSAEALPALDRLAYWSENCLQTLHLESSHGDWSFKSSFTLAKLTELRSLHLDQTNPRDVRRTVEQVSQMLKLRQFTLTNCNPPKSASKRLQLERLPASLRRIKLDSQILAADLVAVLKEDKFDECKISWMIQVAWSEEQEVAVEGAVEERRARNLGASWSAWATAVETG